MAEQKEDNAPEASSPDDFVQIFLMNIEIIKATGLMKADVFGKSDPYCVVNALGQTYTTKTIMKTLDPSWNESTQICTFEDPKELKFNVWDWDKGTQDDPIGDAKLSLNGFFNENHKGFNGELKLSGGKKVKGTITVAVKCRKLLPIKLENDGKRLAKETAKQKEDITNNKVKINQLNNDNKDLDNKNSDLVENIQEIKGSIGSIKDEIIEIEKKSEELGIEITTLQNEKKENSENLDKIKSELENKVKEFNKMQQDFDKSKNDFENLKHEKNSLKQETDRKKKEYEKEQAKKNAKQEEEVRGSSAKPLVDGVTDKQMTDISAAKKKNKDGCCCVVL